MANWFSNVLGVAGPYKEVKKLIQQAVGTPDYDGAERQPVCFQTLYPAETSEEVVSNPSLDYPDREEPASFKDRRAKWGTIRDATFWSEDPHWHIVKWYCIPWDERRDAEDDECCAIIEFSTAWAPPLPLFDKVSSAYPALIFRIRFKESAQAVYGWTEWREGIRVAGECTEGELINAMDWCIPGGG